MGNKKRKNRKKHKKGNNKKKKNITNNDNKKNLCLNDIFVLDEIFLKESIQIMNLKVEDIVKDINIELLNNKILLNNMSNADYEDLTMKQIDNQTYRPCMFTGL